MPHTEEELELPPKDGEGDDDEPSGDEETIDDREDGDPYDDATGDDDAFSDGVDDLDEPSAVGDDAIGAVGEVDDTPPEPESESMLGDDDAPGVAGEDFGLVETNAAVRDAGEEGFDAPEPELRVEDLPRLDDGDDDDLSIEEAADDIAPTGDLRWDDRGFERAFVRAVGHVVRIGVRAGIEVTLEDGSVLRSVDDGATFSAADHAADDDEALVTRGRARALLRDGHGVLRAIDDGPLTLVESTTEATAFTLLDDGSIVAAIDGPQRARLVRIGIDGVAALVAEEDSTIEALAFDSRNGIVWCGGAFGLVAFRA
jgi:hypothetical protein